VTLVINFIDLKDYEGDKKAGIKTLPVICGLKKAKLIIGGFFLISYAILNWVLLDTNLLVPGLIFGGLHFYYINKRQYQEKLVFLTYLLSLLLLFIYLTI
jgi:4-hydroxybenzoate polyprenyltransferase